MATTQWGEPQEAVQQCDEAEHARLARRRRIVQLSIIMAAAATGLWGGGWALQAARSAAVVSLVLPSDFERHQMLLVTWPSQSFSDSAQQNQQELVAEIVAATREAIQVGVLVANDKAYEQAARRLGDDIQYLAAPAGLLWVRDYGPLVAKRFDGSFVALDTRYDYPMMPEHDAVPIELSTRLRLPLARVPITMENGNLLSNGSGLCLTTTRLLSENGLEESSQRRMTAMLRQHLGATRVVYLEPLQGELTGHVDMFATFTAPDTVVVGQYDLNYDPRNAALLDRNADMLSKVVTASGPLRVYRVPMPRRLETSWPTYTNVVFANSVLLVPSYGPSQQASHDEALALYQRLLPQWRIVSLDCQRVIRSHGSLHCATLNVKAAPGLPAGP